MREHDRAAAARAQARDWSEHDREADEAVRRFVDRSDYGVSGWWAIGFCAALVGVGVVIGAVVF